MVVRDMLANPTPRDFVGMMHKVWHRNEAFLTRHPRRRLTLAFIHVKGIPLTISQVATHLRRRLSQIPAMGAARLRLYKTQHGLPLRVTPRCAKQPMACP
jgi:hypothetical protein